MTRDDVPLVMASEITWNMSEWLVRYGTQKHEEEPLLEPPPLRLVRDTRALDVCYDVRHDKQNTR